MAEMLIQLAEMQYVQGLLTKAQCLAIIDDIHAWFDTPTNPN